MTRRAKSGVRRVQTVGDEGHTGDRIVAAMSGMASSTIRCLIGRSRCPISPRAAAKGRERRRRHAALDANPLATFVPY